MATSGVDTAVLEAFWKEALDGAPHILEIVTDQPRVSPDPSPGARVHWAVGASTMRSLDAIASSCGTGIAPVLLAAWQAVLARYCRVDDVVVGVAVAHTNDEGRRTNIVPVRAILPAKDADSELQEGADFKDVVAATGIALERARAHADLPFARVCELRGGSASASTTPVLQALFSAPPQQTSLTTISSSSSSGWHLAAPDVTAALPSNFTVTHDLDLRVATANEEGLHGCLYFRRDLFIRETAETMALAFQTLLEDAAVRPNCPWHSLTLLTYAGRTELLHQLNATEAVYPKDACMHDLFLEQAEAHPDRTACVFLGRRYTYGEIADRVQAVAAAIRDAKVPAGSMVPILFERDVDCVVGIYGVLTAGCAYVPVDSEYPADRMMHIIEQTQCSVLISHKIMERRIPPAFGGSVIYVDELQPVRVPGPHKRTQDPDSLIYVFFTSGTTGKPKGVMVTHRGLVKRIQWFQTKYGLQPEDRVLHKTPYVFGISEWEFFWALPHGGCMVICRPEGHKDPEYLINITVDEEVTHVFHVPSMLTVMLEYMKGNDVPPLSMKHVFCCGEALPVDTCHSFWRGFRGTRLHNLYGPTEADMTFWECPELGEGDKLGRIPIGRPMDNVRVYVLDNRQQPVPAGVPGELYFGGETTAAGYLNLATETQKRFLPNPFFKGGCGKMYRTGDLVRWRSDRSELDFLGRVDNQIKLRGFRIELAEIEAVLFTVPGVKTAAVIVHGDTPQTQKLVAYVVPDTVNHDTALASLKSKLPDYMIPSVLMAIPEMPVTSRGKLDRKALPEPETQRRGGGGADQGEFVAASSPTQCMVEQCWQETLGISDPMSITADFVSLGGNSLLAGRITSILRKRSGVHLKATAMYTHATIEKIAKLIDAGAGAGAASEKYPPRNAGWYGYSSGSFFAVFFQLLALMFLQLIGNASFLPGYYILFSVYATSGITGVIIGLPPMLAGTYVLVMVLTVVVKSLVFFRAKPGVYPVWGAYYLRWWFCRNLLKAALLIVGPLLEDTALYNWWLRSMGLTCGSRVLINTKFIGEPSLIEIGDDVRLELNCVLLPHAIESGCLVLRKIKIGSGTVVRPRAFLVSGTVLEPDTEVGPLSSTGAGSRNIKPTSRRLRVYVQNWSRALLGVPIIILVNSVAFVPAVLFLEWMYYHGGLAQFANQWLPLYSYFGLLTAVATTFIVTETFFLTVVLFKWFFIGKFWPGPRTHAFGEEFRRWLHERFMQHTLCEQNLRRWHSTEVLAIKYRLLGAKYGVKTQPDFVQLVEHDLLTVEDGCVFGSNVNLIPVGDDYSHRIVMRKDAQVLDHCTIMPGVEVGAGALVGTNTVGQKHSAFQPFSINVGNKDGKAMMLRKVGDIDSGLVHLPPDEREAVRIARANHRSDFRWFMFNMACGMLVLLFAMLPQLVGVITMVIYYELTNNLSFGYVVPILISVPLYFAMVNVELVIMVLMKYLIIGRYKVGNYPFYAGYHHKWILMMCLNTNVRVLLEEMGGSIFVTWVFRALGAKVGSNACIFGHAMEYDLLQIGENASVGDDCDLTCHTVENMVIKLAPVKIGRNCTIRAGGIVMPGGETKDNTAVQELSVVLKGEVVTSGTTYAGLPADRVFDVEPVTPSETMRRRYSKSKHFAVREDTPLLTNGVQ